MNDDRHPTEDTERERTGLEPDDLAPDDGEASPERARGPSEPAESGSVEDAQGADADVTSRPGVPMEAEPHRAAGAARGEIPRQRSRARHFHRAGLHGLTPVYGTAQPPYGVCGRLRGWAYRIPEHRAGHWALLLVADRLDRVESRAGALLARLARGAGAGPRTTRVLERNALPILLGVGLAGALMLRACRRRHD